MLHWTPSRECARSDGWHLTKSVREGVLAPLLCPGTLFSLHSLLELFVQLIVGGSGQNVGELGAVIVAKTDALDADAVDELLAILFPHPGPLPRP